MACREAAVPVRGYIQRQPMLPSPDVETAFPDPVCRHPVGEHDLGVGAGRHDQLMQAIKQRPLLAVHLLLERRTASSIRPVSPIRACLFMFALLAWRFL